MKPSKSQFEAQRPEQLAESAQIVGKIASGLQTQHTNIQTTQKGLASNFSGTAATAEATSVSLSLATMSLAITSVNTLKTALSTGGTNLVTAKGKVTTALTSATSQGFAVDDGWKVSNIRQGPGVMTAGRIALMQSVQEKITTAINGYSQADDTAANNIKSACGVTGRGGIASVVAAALNEAKVEGSRSLKTWKKSNNKFDKVYKGGEWVDRPEGPKHLKPSLEVSTSWDLLDKEASVWGKSGKGNWGNKTVGASGNYDVSVLQAIGQANASIGDGQISLGAHGELNLVSASGQIEGHLGALSGEAEGSATVGVEGNANLGVGWNHLSAGVDGFAGAKAGVSASATAGGVGAKASAGVSAGIGGEASVDAGMEHGKFVAHVDLGATLGIGANVDLGVTVDPKKVVSTAKHVVHDIEPWHW